MGLMKRKIIDLLEQCDDFECHHAYEPVEDGVFVCCRCGHYTDIFGVMENNELERYLDDLNGDEEI